MRQCDGMGGWVRLKFSCAGVGAKMCGCKTNDLMKEETGNYILFYPPWPLVSHIRSVFFLLSFSPQASASPKMPLCFPEIAGCLGPFPLPKSRRMRIRCWAAINLIVG